MIWTTGSALGKTAVCFPPLSAPLLWAYYLPALGISAPSHPRFHGPDGGSQGVNDSQPWATEKSFSRIISATGTTTLLPPASVVPNAFSACYFLRLNASSVALAMTTLTQPLMALKHIHYKSTTWPTTCKYSWLAEVTGAVRWVNQCVMVRSLCKE